MKAIGVASCLLLASCTGSATPLQGAHQPSTTRGAQTNPSSDACDCSDAQTTSNERYSLLRRVSLPDGFWCAESRKNADDSPLHVCFNSEGTCNTLRQDSLSKGNLVGTCQESDAAFCFTMTDAAQQQVHWRCYQSLEDCQPLRKKWLGDEPTFRFGECALTKPDEIEVQKRTASR